MTALAARGINPTGHGKNLTSVLGGEVGGDERSAVEIGLHHHGALADPGHDAVANGKGLLVRRPVEWELGHHRPVPGNALEQIGILRRKHAVNPGSQHGDGPSLGADGALVRGGVDAPGTATDHGDTGVSQLIGQLPGDLRAVRGGESGSHQRNAPVIGRNQRALHVEDDRRIVDFPERTGILGIQLSEHSAAVFGDAAEFAGQVHVGFPGGDGFGCFHPDSGHGEQLGCCGLKNGGGISAKVRQKLPQSDGSDVFDHVQGHQGFVRTHGPAVCRAPRN